MKLFRKKYSGFTLIEAAIVLFIVSLLMLIILPNLNAQRKHAVTTHAAAMVTTVQTQIEFMLGSWRATTKDSRKKYRSMVGNV